MSLNNINDLSLPLGYEGHNIRCVTAYTEMNYLVKLIWTVRKNLGKRATQINN